MKNLEKAFKHIQEINPSEKLGDLILQKIEITSQKQIQQKLISSYIYMFGSLALFIYSGFVFGQEILQSEFWSVASLLFSDMAIVMTNWRDFLYSLLETFPIINTIVVLTPIALSLHFLGKNLDLYHQSKHKFVNF